MTARNKSDAGRSAAGDAAAYPTLEAKVATHVHSLVRNHALIDGNKRLGLAALLVFLGVNGVRVRSTNESEGR